MLGCPAGGAACLSTVTTRTRSDSHASAATLCPKMRVSAAPLVLAAAFSCCDEIFSACTVEHD